MEAKIRSWPVFSMAFISFMCMITLTIAADMPCESRAFDQDSVVCVCNSSYCDTISFITDAPPTNPIPYWYAFVSSRDGDRLKSISGSWTQPQPKEFTFHVGNTTKQTIMGFGGAFTDAATMTINSLPKEARTNLIKSYFSETGLEYTFGRIPMASCDFSSRLYSYDDSEGDFNMDNFTLNEEDILYKIPVMKDALSCSKNNLSFFGSPWSAPAWMKTNKNMTGKGTLIGEPGGKYYKAWAKYFVKFLESYNNSGIDIWGITAQNEPTDGMITDFPFQCLGFTAELQRDFIKKDLGPALEDGGFGHVKLMILDDDRLLLPYWAEVVLKDKEAAKYVSGIGVHWYEDLFVPPVALDNTYDQFGEQYFILGTEACEQDLLNKSNSVQLGNWHRAERYFVDILQDLSHGVSGWVDWNIALNMEGGPNWQDNRADSPIIVNTKTGEFYKQPMFYAMGHFSKFVRPGARVIDHSASAASGASGIQAIFFELDVRGGTMLIANLVNTNDEQKGVTLYDSTIPFGSANYDMPARSFATFYWWREM